MQTGASRHSFAFQHVRATPIAESGLEPKFIPIGRLTVKCSPLSKPTTHIYAAPNCSRKLCIPDARVQTLKTLTRMGQPTRSRRAALHQGNRH
ncbi:hypothetical protein AN958_10961 [Leucoagaricus sp. SymC.cos]|nr:hypothetical protein AN958_10961 [Leucoagaricus sp. SymC.cos]